MRQTFFKGAAVSLEGDFPSVGTKAPDFTLTNTSLTEVSLASILGKYLILNIFPSVDTGVCATSVRTFNKLASGFDNTIVLCISKDLPFAHKRFCGAEGLDNVLSLSDFKNLTFAKDYGVLMTSGPLSGLMARAIVIIDPNGNVVHTEMVPDITKEPDYEAALSFI